MKNRLGVIVIGQSPRPDCVELFGSCLGEGDEVIVTGCLDDMSPADLETMKPAAGEKVLVGLDRNMNPITIPDALVRSRIPEKIREMEQAGANLVMINCSGRFERPECSVPLILPGDVLEHAILAIAAGRKVGVIVPDAEQIEQTRQQFIELGVVPQVEAASPFGPRENLAEACGRLEAFGPEIIVMDCTSFDSEIRAFTRELTGKAVITAESVLLKFISEMAGK